MCLMDDGVLMALREFLSLPPGSELKLRSFFTVSHAEVRRATEGFQALAELAVQLQRRGVQVVLAGFPSRLAGGLKAAACIAGGDGRTFRDDSSDCYPEWAPGEG